MSSFPIIKASYASLARRSLVYGVGKNDSDYIVCPKIDGKKLMCPFYKTWSHMLERCYSEKLQKRHPSYSGCTVCDEWLLFSNFRAWMSAQEWRGNHLDKDIISEGNKTYCKEYCAFVSKRANLFTTNRESDRGSCLIGVYRNLNGSFSSHCGDNEGNLLYLGVFKSELDAHMAWREQKNKIAKEISKNEHDQRVSIALLTYVDRNYPLQEIGA